MSQTEAPGSLENQINTQHREPGPKTYRFGFHLIPCSYGITSRLLLQVGHTLYHCIEEGLQIDLFTISYCEFHYC